MTKTHSALYDCHSAVLFIPHTYQVNGCEYGLGSSVFSLNHARAERIAAGIRAGMCNLNDFGVNYLCQSLPFGGVKVWLSLK